MTNLYYSPWVIQSNEPVCVCVYIYVYIYIYICIYMYIYIYVEDGCEGDHPDDGGSKHLWNVDKLLWDYMSQLRRQTSSYPSLWEPQISLCIANSKTLSSCTFITFGFLVPYKRYKWEISVKLVKIMANSRPCWAARFATEDADAIAEHPCHTITTHESDIFHIRHQFTESEKAAEEVASILPGTLPVGGALRSARTWHLPNSQKTTE
jgi:hypothetical protein